MPIGETKYQPEFAKQARKLCLLGATDEDLADFFGVVRNTVINWRNEYPEFARATREGKRAADLKVMNALYRRCIGFRKQDKYFPPDPTSIIWWMKNRMGWRDKPDGDELDATAEAK